MANKIDSNITGLRFAEETSPKVVSGSANWYLLEPNTYSDFGGQIATVARNPINPSRQRKKGVTTDLDASGGFQQDLTVLNSLRLLQGFFFADIREKKTNQPMNSAALPITGVTGSSKTYAAASGLLNYLANHLVYLSGFGVAANNGLKTVASASTATALVVVETSADEASPPATAEARVVGYKFASATLDVVMNGSLVRLNRASGSVDFTTLGLIPGEWIYLGDDTAGNRFANNNGYARVSSVAATYIELDKVSWTPANETGTGKTIYIYFGSVLKNEDSTDIVRRTYQLERTLGEDNDGVMSEYLTGAVPNELTLNVPQAGKVTLDMTFVATDNEQRTGVTGVKTGTRVDLATADAFNTSDDFSRIQLAIVDPLVAAATPLFAYATELTITLTNNVTPNKAVGVLGAFDTSAGTFEVGGSLTAYFSSITAVQAVRNNSDITIDMVMAKANKGIVWDIPLMSLGNGRLNVEQDQPITLPLEQMGAESSFGHTLLFGYFPYLPTVAM